MAPNLLGKSSIYDDELKSAEPVQIIGKTEIHQETKPHLQLTQSTAQSTEQKPQGKYYKWDIVWRNVFIFIYLHIAAVIGLYYWLAVVQWKTFFYTFFLAALISQGVTSGAHRLWAHKTYKAKLPLRILFCILQTAALQNDLYEWSRDHRVHHKFTDTDADPHNANRGFFFSHMGWLLVKKHKDVITKGRTVDMTDLDEDIVVTIQRKFYVVLAPIFAFLIPTLIPWYFWNEDLVLAFHCCAMFRYVISLHGTWLVNSAAHMYGTKPYDRTMKPVECIPVAYIAFGEGWHNYHHVFPWDYKAAELETYGMNLSLGVIDFFAKIGWAYDLKTASIDMIKKRVQRTGDGSWRFQYKDKNDPSKSGNGEEIEGGHLWGWGDSDMLEYDMKFVEVHNKHE